jgi:hypothetical protein
MTRSSRATAVALRSFFKELSPLLGDPVVWFAMISLACAAWFPVSLFWSAGTSGPVPPGLDGPASWISRWWFRWDSPAVYQPWLPLACGWIAWARRSQIAAEMRPDPGNMERPRRVGDLFFHIPFLPAGLILLVAAHLAHVPTLAVAALQMLAWGVVQVGFGPAAFRAARLPLLLLLGMSFPPETVMGMLRDSPAGWMAQSVSGVANRLGLSCLLDGTFVQTSGGPVDLGASRCAVAAAVGGAVASTTWAIVRRLGWQAAAMRVLATALLVLSLEWVRCLAAVWSRVGSPAMHAVVVGTTAWIWVIPAVAGISAAHDGWLARLVVASAAAPVTAEVAGRSRGLRPGRRGKTVSRWSDWVAEQIGWVLGMPFRLFWAGTARTETWLRALERRLLGRGGGR